MTSFTVRSPDRRPGGIWYRASAFVLRRPAALLVILSMLFGTALIVLNPPLRGPDEQAHFVRIYAYARGVIVPSLEVEGRKGIFLPAAMHDDYIFFDAFRANVWTPDYTYATALRQFFDLRKERASADQAPVFVPFEGSEAYTIVAYAPYIVAALVARLLSLDFLGTILLLRFAGLAAFTVLAAYAVAVTPRLQWAFFLIALLPSALYGRAVVGADGAAVSLSLMVVALALRAAITQTGRNAWERSLWMTLCVLSKPPQIAFILAEPMVHRLRELPRRWRTLALVMLPGAVLSLFWIWLVDAEMGAWRLYGADASEREQLSILWKLKFIAENPLHFPRVMAATLVEEAGLLWRQMIGVLGWLDTPLNNWMYPILTVPLLLVMLERLDADLGTRLRLAAYAAAIITGYTIAVFLILFITWTPPTVPGIWGVQGRYFVGVLPVMAILIAALANRQLPLTLLAAAAVLGAALSGLAAAEALWRINWAP